MGVQQPYICIGYSEINKYAIQIYERHFNHENYGDITRINPREIEDFDLLVGGFPCQSFSIAGKRGGFSDTRGTLFFEIARIVKQKQPRLLLLENVKGLLSHDEGKTFFTIIATLDELGYDLQWQVLNSKDFGVPQNRERVFIIGHLRGTSRPEVFPFGENGQQLTQKREGLKAGLWVQSLDSNYYKGADGKRTMIRTAPTIRAEHHNTADVHYIPGKLGIRRLTPTECERLQGFPDGWTEGVSDTQRYKCLGNAVTVNVTQAIYERLFGSSTGKRH
jgi:DNA (cytosine-5)-methyltransferase 1